MEKRYTLGNIVIFSIMLLFDIFYMFGGGLRAKTIASVMFFVAGIVNFMYCIEHKISLKFPKWMVSGLFCAMIADVALVLNFYVGVLIFAVAHVFYFISYCNIDKINRKDLVCGLSIFVFALFVINFAPFLNFGSIFMKNICCAYALVISLMVGKAISNLLREKSIVNITIVIGSVLFFISDLMLMFNKFGNIPGANYLCLGTYYLAQFILAFSLFKYSSTKKLVYNKDIKSLKDVNLSKIS